MEQRILGKICCFWMQFYVIAQIDYLDKSAKLVLLIFLLIMKINVMILFIF